MTEVGDRVVVRHKGTRFVVRVWKVQRAHVIVKTPRGDVWEVPRSAVEGPA